MDEMAEQDKPYEERVLFLRRQQSQTTTQVNIFKGPLRVLRLCLLGILLPCLLCIIVLHMRYRVYIQQMYPLATSDMRLLDNRVSSTWCQRQVIRANTTFNAFLLPEHPSMVAETKLLSMVRHLVLEDDTKEYWGFYLLRGSTVTLSSCVRWPGASLIVIRGHKHLHECAYIGDNSSEELDEIMEALAEGTYIRVNQTDDSAPSNTPQLMKRHRDDVQFHNPLHTKAKNHTLLNGLDMTDITDPKQFKSILDQLYAKTKGRQANVEGPKNHTHVHRNSTIAKGEQRNFKFEGQQENTANMSSEEVMRDVLNKLQKLGEKGNIVLDKINEKFRKGEMVNGSPTREHVLSIRGRHYAKPPVKYDDNIDRANRRRRDLVLSQAMATDLNENDEENDAAIEEGLFPDGIADDRGTINETTLNDRSNSEFWSSFSSSEEALLNCAGLILNLPLTPHKQCRRQSTDQQIEEAYTPNTITYTVPTNGYYFFVYNSENEVQANYIRVRFNLHKKLYNVSNPVAVCRNTTDYCAFDLSFFSNEKLVMELPVKENEDLWNQEFVVVSECEPRTAIYLICVITVPILVILFAFQ